MNVQRGGLSHDVTGPNLVIGRGSRVQAGGPALKTVANVPMISTGIEYPLASGLTTFTEEDLADAVAAFDDPAIHAARTKIGHVDPRFNATIGPDGIPRDGEPSLGSWQNCRLSDDLQTIYGDIVGCPAWLADIMGTAFPSRSVEGNFDVTTVTGHTWRLVIESVALLGVIGPGVTTLDDLPILFSDDGPGVEVIEAKEGEPMSVAVAARRGAVAAAGVNAAVNIEDVRRDYYDQLEAGQMWWWVRAMYVDPFELIVDDDEGGLYRVPFDPTADPITFGEAKQVVIQYVDAPKTKASASLRASLAGALRPAGPQASYTSRSESRPGTQVQGGAMTPEQLRESLGLPADATAEQVAARTAEIMNANEPEPTPAPEPVTTPPAAQAPEPEPEPTPEPELAPVAGSVQVPEGMVLVDGDAWKAVQANAQAGADVASKQALEHKDRTLKAAVKAGKFPPAALKRYDGAWDLDPEGTEALLDLLPDDSVPIHARGVEPTVAQANNGDDPGYNQNWLAPAERARIAAAAQGQVPTITIAGD